MTPSTTPPRSQWTLRARTPTDLLAAVPLVLGFHPQQSLVMLTFPGPGQGENFHARIDLPEVDQLELATAPLLSAARRHRVSRVAFVVYTDDADLAARAARDLVVACAGHLEVAALLRAHGDEWFDLTDPSDPGPHRHDPVAHPFAAQAVYEGRVTHRDRAALAATLHADDDQVVRLRRRVAAVLAEVRAGEAGDGVDEGEWVAALVAAHAESGERLADDDAVRLLVDLTVPRLRDLVWSQLTRDSAAQHVQLWTGVLTRAPQELAPAPAILLAFAAWLSGHGALAWCALDRCLAADPDDELAALLAQALEEAVPPSAWDDSWGMPGEPPVT